MEKTVRDFQKVKSNKKLFNTYLKSFPRTSRTLRLQLTGRGRPIKQSVTKTASFPNKLPRHETPTTTT